MNLLDTGIQLQYIFEDNNKDLYAVGGYVRDSLMGVVPNDLDMVSTASIEEIEQIAQEENIRFIPTGLYHGTCTLILNDYKIEITTIKSIKEDIKRRDFTINSLYKNLKTNTIIDYNNCEDDIKNKMLRFNGNPEDRINEDPIRILRYIRFLLKYDLKPVLSTTEITNIILKNVYKLQYISRERLTRELIKILENYTNDNQIFLLFTLLRSFKFLNKIDTNSLYQNLKTIKEYNKINQNKSKLEYFQMLYNNIHIGYCKNKDMFQKEEKRLFEMAMRDFDLKQKDIKFMKKNIDKKYEV